MNMTVFERLLLQTAVTKTLKGEVDETRAEAQAQLEAGDMKRPRGLGSVSLSEPGVKAKVVDDAAFRAHCESTGDVTVSVVVDGPLEEVLAVLAEHAPHLIGERTYIPDWLIKQELDRAEAGESVPGVEVSETAPRLIVRTKDAAMREAAAILQGTPLAIEGGDK